MLLRSPRPLLLSVLACASLLFGALAALSPRELTAGGEELDYKRQPDALIASLEIRPGELAAPAPLRVRIWGDGRVDVARPKWQRHAGQFELRLSQSELQALLLELSSPELVAFDAARVKQQQRDAAKQRLAGARETGKALVFRAHSSGDATLLVLNLSKYRGACEQCGFDLVVAPIDELIRKTFPDAPPGAQLMSFTTRCALCQGTQVLRAV